MKVQIMEATTKFTPKNFNTEGKVLRRQTVVETTLKIFLSRNNFEFFGN